MAARSLLPRLLVATLATLLALGANAETLFGIYAGAGTWHQNSEGYIQSNGTKVDTKQDMGLGDDDGNVLAVAFEHPIPFVQMFACSRLISECRAGSRSSGMWCWPV